MRSLNIWPHGLIGRVTLVLLFAVLAEFLGSSLLYERLGPHVTRTAQVEHLAEQLVAARRVLDQTPAERRPAVARGLSTGPVSAYWRQLPALPETPERPGFDHFADDMRRQEPSLQATGLRLYVERERGVGRGKVAAATQLSDQSWVMLSAPLRVSPWAILLRGAGSAAVLALGVAAAAAVMLRSLGLPLQALADAAESVGQGAPVHVREEGARDLRRVAQAFNAMQRRIHELLSARTHALAAVSHDLRTPLTRLRLRANLVREPETRAALDADLEEMNDMLDSLLAYLAGQHETEKPRLLDVAALCITLCDAATDAGATASYVGPEHLMARLRPLSLKRAIGNLIDNAVFYGAGAQVEVIADGDSLVICVSDDGPGIPEAELSHVVEAFTRLDDARARNTAGLGLGLSIVHGVARGEGGSLVLANRTAGGLRAEMRLPLRA